MIVGIDLGTTNSLVADMAPDGPRVIPNALGEPLTPSVVGIDLSGNLLVGRAAKELQVVHPDRCASLFKRLMGTDEKTDLCGRSFEPEELSSLVLRSLKEDAEAFLGQPVERAVITVPAYFNDQQRKATITAGRIAGFRVERILNEPTAAAMAYGFHESRDEKLLIVFDLGGGTFDVSLVELFEGVLEVRASAGESFLGGEDFTRTLASRVLETRGYPFERTELEHPRLVSRMIQQCEQAKLRLSSQASTNVRVPTTIGEFDQQPPEVAVTRAQFESWTSSILGRIELPVRRVLGDARVNRAAINEIILVGGATRMPALVARVRDLFGKAPQCRINPDQVVALGAAIQAGLIAENAAVADLVVTDVAPFTLGVEVGKTIGFERKTGYFLPVIHRNTTIPTSRVERVSTMEPNQTEVRVKIYQGESRHVENNLYLGEFKVKGIPRGPAGQSVDVRFTYDLNGILEVEATVVETGKAFSHVVTRYAQGMSAGDVSKAVTDMQNLKRHPRDEAENQFVMRRAERLLPELPYNLRGQFERLLEGFEEALELRDEAAAGRFREALQQFFDRFDAGDIPHDDFGNEFQSDAD
jgi:molecular chaperone HscC